MTDAAKTRHPTTDLPHTKENLSDRSQDAVRLDAGLVFTRRDTGDLLLDLYRPLSAGAPVPVIVWLHGGGWFTGDRTLAPDLAQHVADTGMAVASIEYRLSGQALFPAQLHDVRAAICFLRASAEELGLDSTTLVDLHAHVYPEVFSRIHGQPRCVQRASVPRGLQARGPAVPGWPAGSSSWGARPAP